jgi:hypothetical protein
MQQVELLVELDTDGTDAAFRAVTVRSHSDGRQVRVYNALNTGYGWEAPDVPRHLIAGSRYWYKLQVSGAIPSGPDAEEVDPCREFLESFLPVAKEYLVELPSNAPPQ